MITFVYFHFEKFTQMKGIFLLNFRQYLPGVYVAISLILPLTSTAATPLPSAERDIQQQQQQQINRVIQYGSDNGVKVTITAVKK